MKRPTKARVTANDKAIANLAVAITDLRNSHDAMVNATNDLNQRIGALEAVETAKVEAPSPADIAATEDMLVGTWMSEQRANGVTNVDLSIVDHIRTGINLALAAAR